MQPLVDLQGGQMKGSQRISERQLYPSVTQAASSRRFTPIVTLLALSLCMVIGLGTASAQNEASINGVVKDPSGSVIPGATVTATDTNTGIQKTVNSDESGRYIIPNLVPSVYNVSVAHQGFATVNRAKQELLVGTAVTLDFSLPVSSV